MNYVLSIHDTHNSSAALMIGDSVVCAIQEERLSGLKFHTGFPHRAITWCLQYSGIQPHQLTHILFSTKYPCPFSMRSSLDTKLSIPDYKYLWRHDIRRKYFTAGDQESRSLFTDICERYRPLESHPLDYSYSFLEYSDDYTPAQLQTLFLQHRLNHVSNFLSISPDKVHFLEHHLCHAAYAVFSRYQIIDPTLVLTLDGGGDGTTLAYWLATPDNQLQLLSSSSHCPLGKWWKVACVLLNMKPMDDEYKLMGMAPYANHTKASSYLEKFCDLIDIGKDGTINLSPAGERINHYLYFLDLFKNARFDLICAAFQLATEHIVSNSISRALSYHNLSKFSFGGGISMNVKLNMCLNYLPAIDSYDVAGSGGDESLSIGAIYAFMNTCKPLSSLSLGYPSPSVAELSSHLGTSVSITHESTIDTFLSLIHTGHIGAYVSGQSEFGARALGNRSILANPSLFSSIAKINSAIKKRDFWMPFALSVLDCDAHLFLDNPKSVKGNVMATSFRTLPDTRHMIIAGTHPYDGSCRAHIVSEHDNPLYYELLLRQKALFGIGALLNTSLNLHGDPLAVEVSQICDTFVNSDLSLLLLDNNTLIQKT